MNPSCKGVYDHVLYYIQSIPHPVNIANLIMLELLFREPIEDMIFLSTKTIGTPNVLYTDFKLED